MITRGLRRQDPGGIMNATYSEEHQDRAGLLKLSVANAVRGFDQAYRFATAEDACATGPVDFAYWWEQEFARVLDEHEVSWQYKPRTFAVEWDEEGNFVDSFTPDFFLPAHDAFVELIAPECGGSSAKVRKVRLLRQQHPEIVIELFSGALLSLEIRDLLLNRRA
jgi:hypothetical protein